MYSDFTNEPSHIHVARPSAAGRVQCGDVKASETSAEASAKLAVTPGELYLQERQQDS
jgi:hypothetical protein